MTRRILAITFISLMGSAFSHAQISFNVTEKMAQDYDFMTRSIMLKMHTLQDSKINEGLLTEFESRCIAINTVDLMGNSAANELNHITEQSMKGIEPSLKDEAFIDEVQKRYLPFMQLIAAECSLEQERLNQTEKEANHDPLN